VPPSTIFNDGSRTITAKCRGADLQRAGATSGCDHGYLPQQKFCSRATSRLLRRAVCLTGITK
jgi:hypothetical protein